MTDEELHHLLRQAPSALKPPASFNREVWARIEAEESRSFWACIGRPLQGFFSFLGRPLPAAAAILFFTTTGALLGAATHWKAHADAQRAYVQSINPLLQEPADHMP